MPRQRRGRRSRRHCRRCVHLRQHRGAAVGGGGAFLIVWRPKASRRRRQYPSLYPEIVGSVLVARLALAGEWPRGRRSTAAAGVSASGASPLPRPARVSSAPCSRRAVAPRANLTAALPLAGARAQRDAAARRALRALDLAHVERAAAALCTNVEAAAAHPSNPSEVLGRHRAQVPSRAASRSSASASSRIVTPKKKGGRSMSPPRPPSSQRGTASTARTPLWRPGGRRSRPLAASCAATKIYSSEIILMSVDRVLLRLDRIDPDSQTNAFAWSTTSRCTPAVTASTSQPTFRTTESYDDVFDEEADRDGGEHEEEEAHARPQPEVAAVPRSRSLGPSEDGADAGVRGSSPKR